MAVATNTNVVQFNGGNALSSSWPTDPTGGGVTHFALWTEQVGGSVLAGSPFTYAVSLPSGSPVQFLPESLQVFIPHNIRPGMWHNHLEGSLHGEFTLIAAYRTFEAILARGYTLSASPTRGEVYLGLHRGDAQTSSLGAILPTDSTSLTLVTGVSAQNGDFLRVTANAGDTHEIVRVSDRISATQFAIVRGQPDLDGRDTTQVYHNAGNTVEYLSGPALFNELVNTGRSFPTSPTVGQRFVFNLPASIPTAVDQNGLPVVITVPGDYFIFGDGDRWIRQSQSPELLRDFGAVGYNRVAIVREPLVEDGSAVAYADLQSFVANESGWKFSNR